MIYANIFIPYSSIIENFVDDIGSSSGEFDETDIGGVSGVTILDVIWNETMNN